MRQIICIQESAGRNRYCEYFEFSLPLPLGELHPGDHLRLTAPNGLPLPLQVQPLAFWHDGSIKWLHGIGCGDIPAHASVNCVLETFSEKTPAPPHGIRLVEQADTWAIHTGTTIFTIPTSQLLPFSMVSDEQEQRISLTTSSCRLIDQEGKELSPIISSFHWEEEGPLRATAALQGTFQPSDRANFSCRIHFYAGKSFVRISCTLHNPLAARHPGGVWDLGEDSALLFQGLIFSFQPGQDDKCTTRYSLGPDSQFSSPQDLAHWTIYQESSGGERWRSPVHRNRDGIVPLKQRGFIVEENGQQTFSGDRATPIVWRGNHDSGCAACLPLFWQEFPKEIAATDQALTVSLFPSRFPDLHELQPGEQKTHTFFVDFSQDHEQLVGIRAPLEVTLPPAAYTESGVFTDLPGGDDVVDQFTSIEELLGKRDVIDEYGWRNFGDMYADHEAVYHQGDQPFISHYNNQYDLIAGAYRKFFITGNPLWRQFAADMARHVLDIDLYHTTADREEYNHGLFWHTEHYSDAGLSTHRSYSKEQGKTYELYAGGGGPGAEHCYTTGLMLHYFQTGNPDFKQAVLDLAEWELLALSGPQTLLAALKRGLDHLKQLRTTRDKQVPFPYYPLTRGTGNAITACLDAYEVSSQDRWLESVTAIIQKTLHPKDNIQARDLLNAEIGWSYTVLLVAVGKYLDKMRPLHNEGVGFAHARNSMVAYAEWMAANEYPYLDKPDILEYPNETWAAQDIRKSVVFYMAARYAVSQQQADNFMRQATKFYQYARRELPTHTTCRLTRPIVLLLQNGWVGARLHNTTTPFVDVPAGLTSKGDPVEFLSCWTIVKRLASEFCRILPQTSIEREKSWLRTRLTP